jgi:hypothetical protein
MNRVDDLLFLVSDLPVAGRLGPRLFVGVPASAGLFGAEDRLMAF